MGMIEAERVRAVVESRRDELIALVVEFYSIPAENPPGTHLGSLSGGSRKPGPICVNSSSGRRRPACRRWRRPGPTSSCTGRGWTNEGSPPRRLIVACRRCAATTASPTSTAGSAPTRPSTCAAPASTLLSSQAGPHGKSRGRHFERKTHQGQIIAEPALGSSPTVERLALLQPLPSQHGDNSGSRPNAERAGPAQCTTHMPSAGERSWRAPETGRTVRASSAARTRRSGHENRASRPVRLD
jgi:hypothetical protein